MGDPWPYIQTSEMSPVFSWLPAADLGKPGPYIDPGLYDVPGPAYAPLFSTQTRMTQDARDAGVQEARLSNATDDLLGAITKTWLDPDTGRVHFGTGLDVGRKFDETILAGQQFATQMPGLFNTAYEPAPGAEPKIAPMGALDTSNVTGLILIALLVLLAAKGLG
jgi:hypothetical protein